MTLLLPEHTRLLHIGPAKTGTTSLQNAFHTHRDELAAADVHYAGPTSQPRAAAAAVATGKPVVGSRIGVEAWPELVAEVTTSTAARVVISSETFARCGDKGAQRVVDAFGADRTHVVITMRPLVDMLSSSWQQYVQAGTVLRYEDWLDEMLNRPSTLGPKQPQFWRKTRVDALARRWANLVGADHVTLVSLGGVSRSFVLRVFEELVGVPSGTLVPDAAAGNVSLGFGTAEVVRQFNQLYAGGTDPDPDLRARLVEFGAVRGLRGIDGALESDGRIEVPQWAADRATEIAAEMNEAVRAAGINVVGDLDALLKPSRMPVPVVVSPATVSSPAAAGLLFAMMRSALEQGRQGGVWSERAAARQAASDLAADLRAHPTPVLDTVSTIDLLTYLARRVPRRLARRVRR